MALGFARPFLTSSIVGATTIVSEFSDRPRTVRFVGSSEELLAIAMSVNRLAVVSERLDLAAIENELAYFGENVFVPLFVVDDRTAVRLADVLGLEMLALVDQQVGEEGATAIAQHLTNLTTLNLDRNDIGAEGATAIAQHLTNLTTLNLDRNGIGDEGATAIAQHLTNLTTLNLDLNDIGDEGATAIAQHLTNLTTLNLDRNDIGAEGATAIAQHLTNLTTLNLDLNRIGAEGATAIAQHLTNLTTLNLDLNGEVGEVLGDGGCALGTDVVAVEVEGGEVGEVLGDGGCALVTDVVEVEVEGGEVGEVLGDGGCALGTDAVEVEVEGGIGDEGATAIAQHLTNLTTLDLDRNGIGAEGATAIAQHLTNLTTLNLDRNGIGDEGATAIAQHLTNLTTLNLFNNGIGAEGATAIAQHLTNLTTLNLYNNDIGDEGATAIAQHLTNLTNLHLDRNGIGAEGARGLLDGILAWPEPSRLRILDLRDNGDLAAVLPAEVVETNDAQAILAAYRRFSTERDDLVPLNEAKMLVVGDEAVGKTSLIRFLTSDLPRDPNEQRTEGASLHEEIETISWSGAGADIRLNIWDFGGQEILQGTHRFFLTRRSIYLLVLSARLQDGSTSAFDWMKTIRNRADESPVIVVINKCDDGQHNLSVDLNKLQENYPEIVAVLSTSCDATEFGRGSIRALREAIATTLSDATIMPYVGDKVPQSWLRVKDAVADLAEREHYLPRQRFVDLCRQDETPIELDGEHEALLTTLHNLGVIVYHRRETQVLDPNWLTRGIYAVLDSKLVRDNDGSFDRQLLAALLPPDDYPDDVHDYIIAMMEADDIGMCFALRDRPGAYLVPEALPASEPDVGPLPDDRLRLRFRYDFLPHHVIPRFIVEAHDYLTDKPTAWKTGAVLEAESCRVVARGDRDRRTLEIDVAGPHNRRSAALAAVVSRLKIVHDLNPEIAPKARVPLPERPDLDVSYQHLLDLEEKHGPQYEWEPENAGGDAYRIGDLLHGVGPDLLAPAEQTPKTSATSAATSTSSRSWAWNTILAAVVAMVATTLVILVGFVAGLLGQRSPWLPSLLSGRW